MHTTRCKINDDKTTTLANADKITIIQSKIIFHVTFFPKMVDDR